jgi:hypothetical protein
MHKNVLKKNTQTVNYRDMEKKNDWKWPILPPVQTSSTRSKNLCNVREIDFPFMETPR